MKPILVTALLFVVALASTASAETARKTMERCLKVPVDDCLNHPGCGINTGGKHVTCTSTYYDTNGCCPCFRGWSQILRNQPLRLMTLS